MMGVGLFYSRRIPRSRCVFRNESAVWIVIKSFVGIDGFEKVIFLCDDGIHGGKLLKKEVVIEPQIVAFSKVFIDSFHRIPTHEVLVWCFFFSRRLIQPTQLIEANRRIIFCSYHFPKFGKYIVFCFACSCNHAEIYDVSKFMGEYFPVLSACWYFFAVNFYGRMTRTSSSFLIVLINFELRKCRCRLLFGRQTGIYLLKKRNAESLIEIFFSSIVSSISESLWAGFFVNSAEFSIFLFRFLWWNGWGTMS